jgi:hypothetical protein
MMMPSTSARAPGRSLVGCACVAALVCLAGGSSAAGQSGPPAQGSSASAALEQCVTAVSQSERSATFSGGMTAIPGSVRMLMRIDVQALAPGEAVFHTITTPGLGVWRSSDWGVKTYRYVKQVTNLIAPALYRAVVHFRWLNAGGHLIKALERHTSRCDQPAPPSTTVTPGR